jgi:DNA-directed RNA polymerase subunit alpha
MGLFRELVEGPLPVEEVVAEVAPAHTQEPVEKLDLTVRTLNSLKRVGVHTVGDLLQYSVEDLMDIRNFGEKSVDEVKEKIESMGLNLKAKEA